LDQVDSSKDARGNLLLFDYDQLGRKKDEYLTSRADANLQAAWTYDGAGYLGYPKASTRYVGGLNGQAFIKTITAYDPLYQPKTVTVTLPSTDPLVTTGAVTATTTQSTAYNRDGSLQSTTEPALGGLPSETISAGYDTIGTPTTLQGANSYVLGTTYDAIGQPLQVNLGVSSTNANKAYLTNTYEAGTHRLLTSGVTDTKNPWKSQDLNYSYDQAGKVTGIADPTTLGGTQSADYQCFEYDGYGEITEAWTPKTNSCAVSGRTIANIATSAAGYWNTYTYKNGGIRDTNTRHRTTGDTKQAFAYGATCATGTTSAVRTHTLANITTAIGTTTPTTATYGCDVSGNTTKRPGATAGQDLTWNPEGKLSQLVEGTKSTTYVYDADGNLLIRRPTTSGAVGESVLYLGATEIHVNKTSTATAIAGNRTYGFAGRTVAVRTATKGVAGSKLSWLFADPHGTSTVAIDSTTLTPTKRYMGIFGDTRSGTWVDDKGFLGKPKDASTGLTHIGAREYDPTIGRFLSVDPVLDTSDGLSLNGYAYADNSPLNNSDPTGLHVAGSHEIRDDEFRPPPPGPAVPHDSPGNDTGSSRKQNNSPRLQPPDAASQAQTVLMIAQIAFEQYLIDPLRTLLVDAGRRGSALKIRNISDPAREALAASGYAGAAGRRAATLRLAQFGAIGDWLNRASIATIPASAGLTYLDERSNPGESNGQAIFNTAVNTGGSLGTASVISYAMTGSLMCGPGAPLCMAFSGAGALTASMLINASMSHGTEGMILGEPPVFSMPWEAPPSPPMYFT
jgi:RHS repeat-associated protein